MARPRKQKLSEEDALYLAWERGLLEYKLHEGQQLIEDSVNKADGKLYVANISRQFGKSYWAVVRALKKAKQKPGSVIKIATAFLSDLEEFILPAFEKILEDCPEELKPKYKVQGSKWVDPNGSQIKLIGLDRKPNGLRGNTIDLIIIDEAGFVKNLDYLYKSIIIPATMHRPDAKVIFTSTPPATPDHPFAGFCERAEIEGCYSHFTIYDNPMVTPEIIADLMKESGGEDSITWRREYLAELIIDAERAIIPEWDESFVQEWQPDEYRHLYHNYVSMDLGVRDFTAVLFGHYDFLKAKLYVEDEVTMDGHAMTTPKLKDAIVAKEAERFGGHKTYRRVSDNNNLMLLQDLGSLHSLHFMATNKDTLEAMVNELRILVGAGRVVIHPRCKMLIGCLKNGIWTEKHDKFDRSHIYKHFDHLAALIYLVRNLDKTSNPIPHTYNVSDNTHYIPEYKKKTDNQRTLEQLFGPKFGKKR